MRRVIFDDENENIIHVDRVVDEAGSSPIIVGVLKNGCVPMRLYNTLVNLSPERNKARHYHWVSMLEETNLYGPFTRLKLAIEEFEGKVFYLDHWSELVVFIQEYEKW